MIHILETNLSPNKSVYIALTKIYGINKSQSLLICKKLGFALNYKVFELSKKQQFNIIQLIDTLKININSDLLKLKRSHKQNLLNMKSYRGIRNIKGFPVRGQRTRSNAKTSRKIK